MNRAILKLKIIFNLPCYIAVSDNVEFPKLTRRNFMKLVSAMGASAFLTTYKADIVKAVSDARDHCILPG